MLSLLSGPCKLMHSWKMTESNKQTLKVTRTRALLVSMRWSFTISIVHWMLLSMIPWKGSYPTIFTGRLTSCTISACWPMTHVYAWLSRSVCCSLSSIRTALTHMFLMTEATDHPQRILCLVNSGLLLLIAGGGVPGSSGADVMKSTSADTCFTISSVAPPPLNLTLFYSLSYRSEEL